MKKEKYAQYQYRYGSITLFEACSGSYDDETWQVE